jgi:RNA polymerase sigma factor (sigma-70 family)
MLTDPSSTGDDDLVREVVAGSHDALAALYDRHVSSVFATARRLAGDRQLAEEVVQETFLTLWNRAELFDPRAGSLAAWLRTIARNKTVDRLRAAGRRPRLLPVSQAAHEDESDAAALDRLAWSGSALGSTESSPDPERIAISRWTQHLIQRALSSMPEDERTVIVMAYDGDLSQAEIADRLGWPLGTVKTRTRRALRRLREVLEADLGPGARGTEPAFASSVRTDGSH